MSRQPKCVWRRFSGNYGVKTALDELTEHYRSRQRVERPTSQLADARQRHEMLVKRSKRQEDAQRLAEQRLAKTQKQLQDEHTALATLKERLQRFERDNTLNLEPIEAEFRLDAGFGTYEDVALLIEMGYEVYTKLQNWKVLASLRKQVTAEAAWAWVGTQASMFAWEDRTLESFCYSLDVGLERFTDGERVKYCALLHAGPTAVTQDLPAWFDFYSARQTIEAGIKESKQTFQLRRLKVRSEIAIRLQENFVLFAANFIRWANAWLAAGNGDEELNVADLGIKELVQVGAHTSAQVVRNSEGKLLRFSEQSVFAGKALKLSSFAYQLPLPLGKSCDFLDV